MCLIFHGWNWNNLVSSVHISRHVFTIDVNMWESVDQPRELFTTSQPNKVTQFPINLVVAFIFFFWYFKMHIKSMNGNTAALDETGCQSFNRIFLGWGGFDKLHWGMWSTGLWSTWREQKTKKIPLFIHKASKREALWKAKSHHNERWHQ